jgi:hypothetical protein
MLEVFFSMLSFVDEGLFKERHFSSALAKLS